MNRLLFAGLFTEGSTDVRFLESIVKKTLDDIAFECNSEIETELKVITIDKSKLGFIEQVLAASQKAVVEYGVMFLCVHTDADAGSDKDSFDYKINPARASLFEKNEDDFCKILVPIVPVQMLEAWMLADRDLLKKQIGTTASDVSLGIHRNPESISDPKEVIQNAIRLAKEELTRRKRQKGLDISELYQIIGQKLDLDKLETLPSYQKFKEEVRVAFRQLNLLF